MHVRKLRGQQRLRWQCEAAAAGRQAAPAAGAGRGRRRWRGMCRRAVRASRARADARRLRAAVPRAAHRRRTRRCHFRC